MASDVVVVLVCADDHGEGIPPDPILDAAFNCAVAGIGYLGFHRDGIDVGGVQGEIRTDAKFRRSRLQALQ